MRISARFLVLGIPVLGLLLISAVAVRAAEDPRVFLNALREKGYGDTALNYLQLLEKQQKVPADLQETIELEKSDCYRVAAKRAYNPEQAQKFLALAKEHLDKFIKAHPNHPAGAHALLTDSDAALETALQKLNLAKAETGAAKETAMKGAREALLSLRAKYAAVRAQFTKFIEEYAKAPLPTNRRLNAAETQVKNERERTELGYVESLLKEGLINYQVGQTYTDPKSADKKKVLQEGIKLFDECFRKYKAESEIGLQANHWKAKSLQELGDFVTATDIYDEILVMEPEPTGKPPSDATATFYSQVALDRIKLLRQTNKADLARQDLEDWMADHKTWAKTQGYQGMALEFARVLVAEAEKSPTEKAKLIQQVQILLTNIIKIESEYKQPALLLRRQLTPGEGKEPTTIDEATALAEDAANAENWADALKAFQKAVDLGMNPKDAKKLEAAKVRLNQVKLQIAWKSFQDGKDAEAKAAARALMDLGKSDPIAASAAGLAISIAYKDYSKDRKNETLKKELNDIANAIIERWPEKAEADEARVILGQQLLEAGDYSGAYQHLSKVTVNSKRYAATQLLIGQMFWKKYIEEKKKQGEEFDVTAPSPQRAGAIKAFETAVKTLEGQQKPDEPLSETAIDARQILTQALLEAQQPKEACAAVKPLVDSWSKHPPDKVDLAMLRTANAAVKANLLNNDLAEAGKVVTLLIDLGPDTTEVNAALIEFARAIRRETSSTLEAQQAAPKGDFKALAIIDKKLEGLRTIESNMLDKLIKRMNYSLGGMLYLAETLNTVGKPVESKTQYKSILDRAEKDEEFKKTAERMLTRIRAQVIGLLTSEGKYDEAIKQVDKLIADNPKALEPKVEKARILTAQAKQPPANVKRWNAATNEWGNIRVVLQRMPQKPPEYYEAVMNVADGLIQLADLNKDAEKALQAEQLLATTMKLSPKLNGPESVQQFKKTIDNAVNVQKKYTKR